MLKLASIFFIYYWRFFYKTYIDLNEVTSLIKIYPNPASNNILITLSNLEFPTESIEIINNLGIEIKHFERNEVL
jgi:hypothetical protein